MNTRTSKLAVIALIYQDEIFSSNILGVSRKDNPNLMGLPGGKVDEGELIYDAMVREVYEETGLTVKNALPFFFREHGEYYVSVYLILDYEGEISTKELGVVKWVDFDIINKGPFGETGLESHVKFIKNRMK
jgi:8-oxo-dGTP pyrophosphatase MutT (NUDIX family)